MVVIGGTGAGTVPLRQSRVSHHHLRHRPGKARAVVREPLGPEDSIAKYEFMRIADSTGSDDLHRDQPDHPGQVPRPHR
jgi:acetoacetate decarboxylase